MQPMRMTTKVTAAPYTTATSQFQRYAHGAWKT